MGTTKYFERNWNLENLSITQIPGGLSHLESIYRTEPFGNRSHDMSPRWNCNTVFTTSLRNDCNVASLVWGSLPGATSGLAQVAFGNSGGRRGNISRSWPDRCDSDACCNRDVTVVKLAENVPQGCRTKKPTPRTSVCVSR